MKKFLSLFLIVLLSFVFCGCKEYKKTMCKSCGEVKECYKVTWVRISDKYEESWYVCSKGCEDALNVLMSLGGAVKK